MEEKITITFNENYKYLLEFSPPAFWMEYANGYGGLPWEEISEDRAAQEELVRNLCPFVQITDESLSNDTR